MIPVSASGDLSSEPGLWRQPFFVFGGVGLLWVIGWLSSVRRGDLEGPSPATHTQPMSMAADFARLLKTGGPAYGNEVTGVWFQSGRLFKSTGTNMLLETFVQ